MDKTLKISEALKDKTLLEILSWDAEEHLADPIQELVKECMPDKKSKPDEDANRWAEGVHHGYNKAIEDITKALREKGLL